MCSTEDWDETVNLIKKGVWNENYLATIVRAAAKITDRY